MRERLLRCFPYADEAVRLGLTDGYMQEKSSAREEYTPPFSEYAPVNIVVALILNMVWVYVVLKLTDRIERFLGKGGIYVIRKFFGIILLAISARLFTANLTLLIEQFQKAQ